MNTNSPQRMQTAARYPRVAAALTHQWQRASEVATALGDSEESVRYALTKLLANGKAQRQQMPGNGGRPVYGYRLVP
ncbi:putative ArsR family transcriptional regulator [Bradyrhizobium sp. JR1.7]|uniref:hypothetical protein n=1 Tax=unclassified Bradyrhizobium TaxID=2631580 RepID=UPI0033911769